MSALEISLPLDSLSLLFPFHTVASAKVSSSALTLTLTLYSKQWLPEY
jgi:hypothetical protein